MNVTTNNDEKCAIALEVLKNVHDPEIGLNIVDLGLMYGIEFKDTEKKIQVCMTLTSPFCPMGESITGAVKRVLENSFAGMEVEIELSQDPAWDAHMISDDGQKFLDRS